MPQYIDKDALVAEIEKKKKSLPWGSCASQISMECNCKNEAYNDVISLANSMEVKEVDFEKEWEEYFKYRGDVATVNIKHLAKHFFELGMKTSNPIHKNLD